MEPAVDRQVTLGGGVDAQYEVGVASRIKNFTGRGLFQGSFLSLLCLTFAESLERHLWL